MTTASAVPASDIDLFADEVLADPYPAYGELRGLGPVVRLSAHDAWVLPRHEQVRAALADPVTFSSADGVGYEPQLNEYMKGSVLASDPPEHDHLRAVLSEQFGPRAVAKLRSTIQEQADALIERAVRKGSFDAVADVAATFPVTVVADLLGVPEDERDPLLEFADAAFNSLGPLNERTENSLPAVGRMFEYLATVMVPGKLREDGWAAAVYQAADRGEIARDSVIPLLSAYVVASMDTTVHAISNTLWLFTRYPAAFGRVRSQPALVGSAFEESLRLESPVQGFFRVTTRGVDIGGAEIPAGSRVLLSFGAANRDARRWNRADEFDVGRNPVGHVGFGHGIHGCVGQGLARLEVTSLLAALVDRVHAIEPAGEPVRQLNNVIRGWQSLPIAVR